MPGSPGSPKKGVKKMFSSEEEQVIGNFLITCWGKYLKVPQKILYDTLKKHLDKFPRKTSFKDNRPGLFWRQRFFQRNSHIEQAFNKYKESGKEDVKTVPAEELLVLLENLEKAEKPVQQESESSEGEIEVSPTSSAKKFKKKKIKQNWASSDSEDLASKVRKGIGRKRSKTSDPKTSKTPGGSRRGRPPIKLSGNIFKRDKSAPPGAVEGKKEAQKDEAKKTAESPAPSKGKRSSLPPDAVPLNPVKYEVGESIEAMDCGKWYNAKIVEVEKDKQEVLVHYNGWGKKFDTVFPVGSTLIRGSTQKEKKQDFEKFNIGDDVLSKWTDGNFYPGTVISVNKVGSYTVMFYDGLKKLLRPALLKRMTEKEKDEAMKTAQRVYLQSLDTPLNSPPKVEVTSSDDSGYRRYRTSAGDRERRRSSHRKDSTEPSKQQSTQQQQQQRRGRKRKIEEQKLNPKQARLDKITGSLLDKVTTMVTSATTTSSTVTMATSSAHLKKSLHGSDMSDDSESPLIIDEENEFGNKGKTKNKIEVLPNKMKPTKSESFERYEASEVLLQLSQSGGNESSDNSNKPIKQPLNKPDGKTPDTTNLDTKLKPVVPDVGPFDKKTVQPVLQTPDTKTPVEPSSEPIEKPVQGISSQDKFEDKKTENKSQSETISKTPTTSDTKPNIIKEKNERKISKEGQKLTEVVKPKKGKIFLDENFLAEPTKEIKITQKPKTLPQIKVKTTPKEVKQKVKSSKNVIKVKPKKQSPEKSGNKDEFNNLSLKEKLEAGAQKVLLGKLTVTEVAELANVNVSQLRETVLHKHGVISGSTKGDFMLGSDEEVIVNWIHDMTDLGWGILDQHISDKIKDFLTKEMYTVLFNNIFTLNYPSTTWLNEFLSRHPEIFPGRKLPLSRFRIDREGFEDWQLRWLSTLHSVDVAPNGVFYMDEVVWDTNPKLMHNVSFTRNNKGDNVGSKLTGLGSKSKITTLTCIGANGIPLTPFHVFPEGDTKINEQLIMTSQNGTMDSQVLLFWFQNVFLKEITPRRPIALLVDSHLVQINFELLKMAEENHVVIYNFLPAGAHFLQHPDQKLFGRLRMQWKKSIIRQFLKDNSSKQVSTQIFADYFKQEFEKVATSSTIKMCFALTKMYNPVAETNIKAPEKRNKRKMLKPVAYIEDKQENKINEEITETKSSENETKIQQVTNKETDSSKDKKKSEKNETKAETLIEDKVKEENILSETASSSPELKSSDSPAKSTSVSPAKSTSVSPAKSTSDSPSVSTSVSPSVSTSVSPSVSTSVSPTKSTSVSPINKKGYKKGETVLAKWSDCRLYSATILKKLGQDKYKVRYYDGLIKTLKDDFLRPWGSVPLLPQKPKVELSSKVMTPTASPRRRSLEVKPRSRRISELSIERERRVSENFESLKTAGEKVSAKPKKTSTSDEPLVNYELGEQVLCKWTDRKYYPATILKKINEETYKVKYYDNRKKVVRYTWLQSWKPSIHSVDKIKTNIAQPLRGDNQGNTGEFSGNTGKLSGSPDAVKLSGNTEILKLGGNTESLKLGGNTESVKLFGSTESIKLSGNTENLKLLNPVVSIQPINLNEKANSTTYTQASEETSEGKLKKGDSVLARWTDCRSYPATILKCLDADQYIVQYYDGMTRKLKEEMIKKWDPTSAPQVGKSNKKSVSAQEATSKETTLKSAGGKPCFSGLKVSQNYKEFYSKLSKPDPSLNKFKCKVAGCGKIFRRKIVLQQHHKHCHQQQPIKTLQTRKISVEKTTTKRKLSTESAQGIPRSKGGKPPLDFYRMHADLSQGSNKEIPETSQEPSVRKRKRSSTESFKEEILKTNDKLIKCVCGSTDHFSNLIQCLSCNYWQHCNCEGISHSENNEDYVCKLCVSPPGVRKSGIYLYNNDFLKDGKLPSLSNPVLSTDNSVEENIKEMRENKKKAADMQNLMKTSHQLIGELTKLKDSLHGIKRKIGIVPLNNIPLLQSFKETNLNGEGKYHEENGGILGENGGIIGENGRKDNKNGGKDKENGGVKKENEHNTENNEKIKKIENVKPKNENNEEKMEINDDGDEKTPSGKQNESVSTASGSLWVPIQIKKTYTPAVTSTKPTSDVIKDEELLRCRSSLLTHIHDVQDCLSDRLKKLEKYVTVTEEAYERCTGESPECGGLNEVQNEIDVIHDVLVAARDQ